MESAVELFSLQAVHGGAFEFAVGIALFQIVAFVELQFAFADGEGDFHAAIFPIKGEREKRVALDGTQAEQFPDLRFVQQQFADGFGHVVLAVALRVFVNVRVVEIDLVFFHAGEGVADLAFAGAEGFHFRAVEDNPGLESFQNVVIAARFRVVDDVGHKQQQPEDSFWPVARLDRN